MLLLPRNPAWEDPGKTKCRSMIPTRRERAGPSETLNIWLIGILGVSEHSGWPWHPTPDQIVLLREIARRAIWHMPNSRDEARELVHYFDI
jgi:hypothetical protein